MARKTRIDFDGAWHHVMNRGANRRLIFLDDVDRAMFFELLGELSKRFGLEIHAYCMMNNHFHLLVRCPASQLSRAMKHLGQVYTQKFNKRHGRDGALFRGRFHSIVVDSDNYLDIAARYIHLNPVTEDRPDLTILDRYLWSSLAAYEGREPSPRWLLQHEVLRNFRDRDSYANFVRSEESDFQSTDFYASPFQQQRILGGESFANRVCQSANPSSQRSAGIPRIDLADIDAVVLKASRADPTALTRTTRGMTNPVRSVAVQLALDHTPTSRDVLARRYGFPSAQSVTTSAKRSRESQNPQVLKLRAAAIDALRLTV